MLIAGTFNKDLESGRRMKWLLEEFKPDIIIGGLSELSERAISRREIEWARFFDECEIPEDVQEKWRSSQTYKEHLAAENYSHKRRILYFMVDNAIDLTPEQISWFAEVQQLEELKITKNIQAIQQKIRTVVDRQFYDLQEQQQDQPYCKKFYSEKFLCRGRMPLFAEERAEILLGEFRSLIEDFNKARILGFVQGTQIIRPDTIWATQALGRPMHNLRYHLGEQGIQYGQLVDLI